MRNFREDDLVSWKYINKKIHTPEEIEIAEDWLERGLGFRVDYVHPDGKTIEIVNDGFGYIVNKDELAFYFGDDELEAEEEEDF